MISSSTQQMVNDTINFLMNSPVCYDHNTSVTKVLCDTLGVGLHLAFLKICLEYFTPCRLILYNHRHYVIVHLTLIHFVLTKYSVISSTYHLNTYFLSLIYLFLLVGLH